MCPRKRTMRAHGAGRENRTHLAQLGELAPHQSASPAIVPPVGLEPTHFRVRTGCSALELRRRDAATSHATGCRCHPLESNQNLLGFSQARRPTTQEWHREAWVRLVVIEFVCHAPACTVSMRFRCERLLGEPSMHVCCSRLRFGLRGSNSHFQVQSLAFCRLNEARVKSV